MTKLGRFRQVALSLLGGMLLGALIYLGSNRFASSVEVPLAGRDLRQPVRARAYVHRVSPAQAEEWREEQARPQPRNTGQRLVFAPRDPEEWQGMLVNTTFQALCDRSSSCGLAMACLEGRCGPCSGDRNCERGERCVLQHCIPTEQAVCASRADCPAGEVCMLSGVSDDPRGNRSMKSYCSGNQPRDRDPILEQAALDRERELAGPDMRTGAALGEPQALAEALFESMNSELEMRSSE